MVHMWLMPKSFFHQTAGGDVVPWLVCTCGHLFAWNFACAAMDMEIRQFGIAVIKVGEGRSGGFNFN